MTAKVHKRLLRAKQVLTCSEFGVGVALSAPMTVGHKVRLPGGWKSTFLWLLVHSVVHRR